MEFWKLKKKCKNLVFYTKVSKKTLNFVKILFVNNMDILIIKKFIIYKIKKCKT